MKKILIPYIIGKYNDWWGAVDFYNHNQVETSVIIEIQRHSNGIMAGSITRTIAPYCHYILMPDEISKNLIAADQGRATLMITCSENIFLSPYMSNGQGFDVIPFYIVDGLS